MKKFDLEKALAGEPVVTRDGRRVSQLTLFNIVNAPMVLYGVIDGNLYSWSREGTAGSTNSSKRHDLFILPIEKTYWMNVYKHGDGVKAGQIELHETEIGAKFIIGGLTFEQQSRYLGTFPITVKQ